MADVRYQYEKVNVIKIIVKSKSNNILLIREPETNEWMPGHWGLPGGKVLEKESLLQAFERKAKVDLGINLNPAGIFCLMELLMNGKTAMMYHALADVSEEFKPKGEIAGYRWVGKEEVEKMDIVEFTEYFNKKLLLDFLKKKRQYTNFDFVETLDYYNKEEKDPEYIRWLISGKRK